MELGGVYIEKYSVVCNIFILLHGRVGGLSERPS